MGSLRSLRTKKLESVLLVVGSGCSLRSPRAINAGRTGQER